MKTVKNSLKTFAYIYIISCALSWATINFLQGNYLMALVFGFASNLTLESYVVYQINRNKEESENAEDQSENS